MCTPERLLAVLLLAASTAVAARAGHQVPRAGMPTPAPGSTPGAAAPVRIDLLVDRVWVAEGSGGTPAGALYVFLSDNVLVVSSTGKPAAVGTWAEDVSGLVITARGTTSRADVLELTPGRLRLRVDATPPHEIALVPALRPPTPPGSEVTDGAAPASARGTAPTVVPAGSAYRCGADTLRVAFEGDAAYLTWPDGTTLVLREMKPAEGTPSRRTFSDGQLRVVEDTSEAYTRVLFARPGFRPRPCSPTR